MNSCHFSLSIGKVRYFVLLRKNKPSHEAILVAKMMAHREIIKLTTTRRDRAPMHKRRQAEMIP